MSSNRTGPHLDKVVQAVARRSDITAGQKLMALTVAAKLHKNLGEAGASYDGDVSMAYSKFAEDVGLNSRKGAKGNIVDNPLLVVAAGTEGKMASYARVSVNLDALTQAVDDHRAFVAAKVAEIRGRSVRTRVAQYPGSAVPGQQNAQDPGSVVPRTRAAQCPGPGYSSTLTILPNQTDHPDQPPDNGGGYQTHNGNPPHGANLDDSPFSQIGRAPLPPTGRVATTTPNDHHTDDLIEQGDVRAARDGTRVTLVNGLRAKWIDLFGGDEVTLDIALAGVTLQLNSRTPWAAQLGKQLSYRAQDVRTRSENYRKAQERSQTARPSAPRYGGPPAPDGGSSRFIVPGRKS